MMNRIVGRSRNTAAIRVVMPPAAGDAVGVLAGSVAISAAPSRAVIPVSAKAADTARGLWKAVVFVAALGAEALHEAADVGRRALGRVRPAAAVADATRSASAPVTTAALGVGLHVVVLDGAKGFGRVELEKSHVQIGCGFTN